MKAAVDHLAKMGGDTFIYGLIIIGTSAGLAAGAGWAATIAGLGFGYLYIHYRQKLAKVRIMERYHQITDDASERAGKIIDAEATNDEKSLLARCEERSIIDKKKEERNHD